MIAKLILRQESVVIMSLIRDVLEEKGMDTTVVVKCVKTFKHLTWFR